MNFEKCTILKISSTMSLQIDRDMNWSVSAKNGDFPMNSPSDFWRIVVLLESNPIEIKARIDASIQSKNFQIDFPYWKLIYAGFKFELDYWANLALSWLPILNAEDLKVLKPVLEETYVSKWASQKTRQVVGSVLKKLNSSR